MTLNLPWSSFEHMAANWLVTLTAETNTVRFEELLVNALTASDRPMLRLRLPVETAGRLLKVLEQGRQALDSPGVRESEGEGVLILHLDIA